MDHEKRERTQRVKDFLLCFYPDGGILAVRARAGDQELDSTEVIKR